MTVKHSKVSSMGDESNADLVRPSDWNAEHVITGRASFSDQKSTTVCGGSSSATTWHTRDLNTTNYNTITGCSLASNQITLPAGTYHIKASAPTLASNQHKLVLYNITDASYAILGTSEYSSASGICQSRSFLNAQITIAAQKVFEVRHYCTTARVTDGLGTSSNISGIGEVYTIIEIEKIS